MDTIVSTLVSMIYCWEFNYYDKSEDEWLECTYYTRGDNRQIAVDTFLEDEPGVGNNWSCNLDETVTEESFLKVYPTDLILNDG